jgi:hypothetical protein
MKRAKPILVAFVLLASGCVTDKLAVFEESVLTDDEMKLIVGKYKAVAAIDGNGKNMPRDEIKGIALELTKKDSAYHFRYSEQGTSFGSFVLSRIPDSKAGLLLFASPEVKGTEQGAMTIKNVFFIVRKKKEKVQLWFPLGDEPVARDFSFTQTVSQGCFKMTELKEFLKKHADEFVEENPARITFEKTG